MDFGLQPKERALLDLLENSNSQLIGYGGARGGAKSHAIRACAVIRRISHPGTNALVFRRNYPSLWSTHIQRLIVEWPELYQKYWSAEHKALLLPGNSNILFRYADTLEDIMQMRGNEFGDLFLDEANDLTEEELRILYTCCRSTVAGFRPRKVLTYNPGGVGHAYLRRLFIDKQWSPEEAAQKPVFLHAKAWDNLIWVRDSLVRDKISPLDFVKWPEERKAAYLIEHSDYGRELNALPTELRDAWLWGRFDVHAGTYFDIWDPSSMVENMIESAA